MTADNDLWQLTMTTDNDNNKKALFGAFLVGGPKLLTNLINLFSFKLE